MPPHLAAPWLYRIAPLLLILTVGCAQGGDSLPPIRTLPEASTPPPSNVPDTGPPTPSNCTRDAECTDGLSCNGVETCSAGMCVAGAAVTCDDGVSCTNDTCSEPGGSCAYIPDDSLCPSGQRCDAVGGCSSTCSESPCRLVGPQCGCAGGEGCYLDPTSSARVCASAGALREGQPCTSFDGCAAGLLCLNLTVSSGATAVPACMTFCDTDADCPGRGALCYTQLIDASMRDIPGAKVCSLSCDPIGQTGCPAGAACDIWQEREGAMRLFTHCFAPVGAGTQGSTCSDGTACAAGYACIDHDASAATSSICLKWCERPLGSCPAGTACSGFATPLSVSGTTYGVCY